ncbi:ABC transporter substrate-binding protein [Quadrisphaera setariae]|uniref:ABC transporter substrate-binding protein n=1 Tax=Quadrisphaera setariae TaxID=2593304 RepID=A0A5C8ZIS6_9ACTN|nr:ABC transporter substrate-binding protein [Quadrisphaera setariae]TXR57494.1 ABC transporter substrate-binding protein [Quadrisphaera setariae]
MIRSLRGAGAFAVLGVASLTLAACGGGSSDPAATSAAPASSDASASSTAGTEQAPVEPGDGTLTIGTLLPQTGSLAFLGPPEFAGVQLALNDINAAGGYNGKDVVYNQTDSGDTTTNIASQSVDRLIAAKTDAIIGAASSGVSKTVIDAITGAGVIQVSPANTSPDFTDYPDRGLYWRTAPSDVLQGRVMGDLLLQDNHLDVATITLDDPYGSGLQSNIQKSLEAGGGKIVANKVFNPDAATFDSIASEVSAAKPEAVVVIGFEQTVQIIQAMIAQGIGPDKMPIYFVDGNLADYSTDFPAGTLKGVKGTLPGAKTSDDFRQRLLQVDPKLTDFSYAPESYDATVLVALAAAAAKDDSGTAVASKMQEVSEGGTKCTAYKECLDLLNAGTDIDYDGFSGPIDFSAKGDPTKATIGIYQYGDDNKYTNVDYITGSL